MTRIIENKFLTQTELNHLLKQVCSYSLGLCTHPIFHLVELIRDLEGIEQDMQFLRILKRFNNDNDSPPLQKLSKLRDKKSILEEEIDKIIQAILADIPNSQRVVGD